jgi:hypothetical protein
MTTVTIPNSKDGAIQKLIGISTLGSAIEWERAAIVATLVEAKRRGRPRAGKPRGFRKHSINDFARLGIPGLRSPKTIRVYLRIWEMTGLPIPNPGETINLPSQPFPEMAEMYHVDNEAMREFFPGFGQKIMPAAPGYSRFVPPQSWVSYLVEQGLSLSEISACLCLSLDEMGPEKSLKIWEDAGRPVRYKEV